MLSLPTFHLKLQDMLPILSHSYCNSEKELPGDMDVDSGHTLFHSDWIMLPCSPYSHSFLLNFHSFAVNTLTVKARKIICWVFSSLCLYLASIQTALMSSKKKERKFFSIETVEIGWVEMYSRLSCSPNYWSEHFLPLFLTALSHTL